MNQTCPRGPTDTVNASASLCTTTEGNMSTIWRLGNLVTYTRMLLLQKE